MKKGGLGKGLEKLIPKSEIEDVSRETLLRVAEIEPNRDQPRKTFDDESIDELTESIKEHGVIQPIIVVKGQGYYRIVAGERRWRAAKKAGLTKIPAIIKEYTKKQISEVALIENLQRENLNVVDEAFGVKNLIDTYNLKQEEVAKILSKSRPYITNLLRLLNLNNDVLCILRDGKISFGHARALLVIKDEDYQKEIVNLIISKKLSVRQTEDLINAKPKTKLNENKKNLAIVQVEKQLELSLKTKVSINNSKKNKGSIKISYNSLEEFERIIELIRG